MDLRLYALIDPEHAGGRDLAALARLLAQGGATLVQLRDKIGNTRQMVARARAIKQALSPFGVPLLINDRADVALAAQADGIHIGWEDIAAEDARRILGPKAIIGHSIKTAQQVAEAPLDILDYVCIGGVYATSSKNNPEPPIGASGLKTLSAQVRARKPGMPVGAIAGINEKNAAEVIAAGADGVAVISALSLAPDPAKATQDLRAILDRALAARGAS